MYFAKDISVMSFTKISLIFVCYRETPGLCLPTSVTRRSGTGALPPIPGVEPWCIVTHRDPPLRLRSYTGNAPSQTVALPGQTVIIWCPKPGLVRSTAGNIWTQSNSSPIRPGSPRSAGCKLPERTGAYTGTVWTRLKVSAGKHVSCTKPHIVYSYTIVGPK